MDRSGAIAVALAVAITLLIVIVVIYEPEDDKESHGVTYELDGGRFLTTPPDHYYSGYHLDIPAPVKEGYSFQGWYLDEECTQYFDGDTWRMHEDIKLYALWGVNLSGHYVTLSKSGYYDRGFNSCDITGSLTFTYLYYNGDKQSYFIHNDDTTTYTYRYTQGSYTEDDSRSYWSSESDRRITKEYKETIDTAAGKKECDVIEFTYPNGSTETQWIADEWIPYKIKIHYSERVSFFVTYTTDVTYTYVEDGVVELPKDCTVDVYQGYGVTVTGNESPYSLGEIASLTATVESGKEFKGWYDEDLVLLSKDTTYSFVVGGSFAIYALNNDPVDKTFESDKEVDLDKEFGITGGSYVIRNIDTGDEFEAESTFTFANGGPYSILTTDSEKNKGYYEVKVSGLAERTFTWQYDRVKYTLTLEIDYDDLLYARAYYTEDQRCEDTSHVRDKTFVTLSYTDDVMSPYMEELVDKLIEEFQKHYRTVRETDLLGYLLAFTQYIEYQSDEEYMDTLEYWKFPLETLYDQGGDCEDTSILFAALAHEAAKKVSMKYKVALQLLPGHMAGAVKLSGSSFRYPTNPSGYIYAETTSTAYALGEIPSSMYDYFTSIWSYTLGESCTVEID